MQSRWEKQGVEGERSWSGEHRWRVCGVTVWLGFRNSRGHSWVLLELQKECPNWQAIFMFRNGRGAALRRPLPRLATASSPQAKLRQMQPRSTHLRSKLRTASTLRGEFTMNNHFSALIYWLRFHSFDYSKRFSIRTFPSPWWSWRNTKSIIIHSELRRQVLDQVRCCSQWIFNRISAVSPATRIIISNSSCHSKQSQQHLHENPLIHFSVELLPQFAAEAEKRRADDSLQK